MCTPIKNDWCEPILPRINKRYSQNTSSGIYAKTARKNNGSGARIPNNRNVCASLVFSTTATEPPTWTLDGSGRYGLRIWNVNAVLDDAWGIYVNGVYAFTYDGGTQTSFTWRADLLPGAYAFEARFLAEQNDNFFSWEWLNEATVLASGSLGGLGEPGDVWPIGTFNI